MTTTKTEILDQKHIRKILREQFCEILDGRDVYMDASWVLEAVKESLIDEVLVHNYGNQTKSAKMLGISRGTLSIALNQRIDGGEKHASNKKQ